MTIKRMINISVVFICCFFTNNLYSDALLIKNNETISNPKVSHETNLSECEQTPKYLNELSKVIKSNKKAMEIIKSKCLVVLEYDLLDVTGDGKKELIINTSGYLCGSCHYREIYILEGVSLIFFAKGDDVSVIKPKIDIVGFTLKEPLRRFDEGLCCPSEYILKTYKYSPSSSRVQDDLVDAIYSNFETGGDSNNQHFYVYDTRIQMQSKASTTK